MRTSGHRIFIIGLAAAALLLAGAVTCVLAANPELEEMKRKVRGRFPGVAQLSTADLAAWLKDPKREPPVLLDAREPEEFAVSHLSGAIRVDPSARPETVLPQLPKGKAVVTYCSVGYRSSALAEKLIKAGATSVYNLEGSIFQWANEGRPLEANGQPAEKVHPYNAKYGRMLDEAKHALLSK